MYTSTDRFRIAARVERLPVSRWHNKIRLIVGLVNFSDAFDALTVAYVLPVLIPLWHMRPAQIGTLISIGYAGQIFGGMISGWLAERHGRRPLMVANLILFSVVSFCCIFAHSYAVLLTLRFFQGLGLGGEIPIANTYISELAQAGRRARFVLLQQSLFPLGLTTVALFGTFVVPAFGWRWMFILGGVPLVMVLPMLRELPESPRWLVSRGRDEEANRIVTNIEEIISDHGRRALPPIAGDVPPAPTRPSHVRELFQGAYRKRTLSVWVLNFCTYLIVYALSGWLPSIMRSVYHQSVAVSNLHGFILNLAGLFGVLFAAFTLDRIGRRRAFAYSFLLGAVPLLIVAAVKGFGPIAVLVLGTISFGILSIIPGSVGMYIAENYPNHLRAVGAGAASLPQRTSSAIGPYLVGMILPAYGVGGVFGMFAFVAIVGGLNTMFFCTETAGKTLEEMAPSPRLVSQPL